MRDLFFLSGRVIKRSLPVLEKPGGAQPNAKRLLLPHGELAQLYDAEEAVHYIAYLELREGSVRGNHYHKLKEEWIYVIRGELVLWVQNTDCREGESVTLRAGDLGIVRTGVAHAIETVVPGHAIEFSSMRFDPSDVYPFELIKPRRNPA